VAYRLTVARTTVSVAKVAVSKVDVSTVSEANRRRQRSSHGMPEIAERS
jgi:hypothetical protein